MEISLLFCWVTGIFCCYFVIVATQLINIIILDTTDDNVDTLENRLRQINRFGAEIVSLLFKTSDDNCVDTFKDRLKGL